jgi:hypothetical protein
VIFEIWRRSGVAFVQAGLKRAGVKQFAIFSVIFVFGLCGCERHEFEGKDGTKQLHQHHGKDGDHKSDEHAEH